MDRPVPDYVYKIVPTSPPNPLPHDLPLSELDQGSGCIHLSNAFQIPVTALRYFSSDTTIHLLRVSSIAVRAEGSTFKWLDEGQSGCIHLRRPNGEFGRLGSGTVVDVKEWRRPEGKKWDDKEVIDSLGGWLKDFD